MPVGDFSASSTNDIWGWTDSLDGKEYALLGLNNGTAFVDISDPENPVYLGRLPTHTSSSSWRDIKVYNDYAFVVSEAGGHGMQIFDLTELRSVVSPPVIFSNSAHYNGFGNAHNLAINEDSGFAYGVGTGTCSGGLHMVNIQNPLSPASAGCYSGDGYTHDAECVNYIGPDPDYTGAEICFNSNEDTLTIVDVTNKAAPVLVSRTNYPGASYTHQGWALDGHRYYLQGDELDESSNGHNTRTYIWDLLDLDNPSLIGNHTGPNASIDHNMYVVGENVFQSNYSSGLQIFDLSDVAGANLEMIAYFDTYVPDNNASFNGSWSNYPFFESGTVVATGIDEGLFILSPLLEPDFQMSADSNDLDVCGSGSDMLRLGHAQWVG
jgi:choice-of-anchor B domain-containing protein